MLAPTSETVEQTRSVIAMADSSCSLNGMSSWWNVGIWPNLCTGVEMIHIEVSTVTDSRSTEFRFFIKVMVDFVPHH
jgi:hypothetical protein